jgi:hypothetical protein
MGLQTRSSMPWLEHRAWQPCQRPLMAPSMSDVVEPFGG